MSTKSRNQRLHLFLIKNPSSAEIIHVTFKREFRTHTETVKKFAVSFFVKVHADPMLTGTTRRIGVNDDNRWARCPIYGGQFVTGEYSSIYRTVFPQHVIDH